MSEARFEHLVAQLLDDELTPAEFEELVRLAREHPEWQQDLQTQLEASELIAQRAQALARSASSPGTAKGCLRASSVSRK